MTTVVIAALGFSLGLVGLARAWRAPSPSAAEILLALDGSTTGAGRRRSRGGIDDGDEARRPDRLLGRRLAGELGTRGIVPRRLSADLAATDSSLEELCAQAVVGAFGAGCVPLLMDAVLAAGGVHLPLLLALWLVLLLGGAGGLLPVLELRSAAARLRREARVVVAAYLDLVVLCLAGGMGVEGALHAAAGIAENPFSARITGALELARDAGETPWRALAALGEQLGVEELNELAAAVGLAGTEGAKIRSTLAAKAASIRRHQLAEAETEANTLTDRLFLPGVLLLVGFLVFVGYPAVARILGGF